MTPSRLHETMRATVHTLFQQLAETLFLELTYLVMVMELQKEDHQMPVWQLTKYAGLPLMATNVLMQT